MAVTGSNTIKVTKDSLALGGLADALYRAMRRAVLFLDNACLGAAGCAAATTASKVKTVNTTPYRIDGKQLSLAGTDNFWTLTGATLTAGQINKWMLCVDGSGAASVVAGNPAATEAGITFSDIVGADGTTYPAPGLSKSVIGILTVTVNSSTFIPGTTLLSAGTITVTYRDGYEAALMGPQFPIGRV